MGENIVTSRNWVRLFLSTLLVGGVTTGITGFIVRWSEFKTFFTHFEFTEILSILFWLLGVGFIFSLLSQAGFFAYLTIHRFGSGIFKSLWNPVQVVLVAFVLFDLVYFRYGAFAKAGNSIMPYLLLAVLVLIPGLVIALLKALQTNMSAFIPALFFMIVVTIIEWVPVLRVNEESWIYLMLFPLIVCNAFQLLMLPKLNQKSLEERNSGKAKTKQVKHTQKKPSNI